MLAVSTLLSACAGSSPPEPDETASALATKRPSVVIVVLDTVRADALGAALGQGSATPRLDRLTATASRFVEAYSTAPWTMPSHASLFTGLLPSVHGAVHGRFQLADNFDTLAELLLANGYRTAGFTCNPWLHQTSGLAQGFTDWSEVYRDADQRSDKGAAKATAEVVTWLETAADQAQPFLLFVNYLEAHLPYAPRPALLAELGLDQEGATNEYTVEDAEAVVDHGHVPTPEELHRAEQLYLAEVRYVDQQVGVLIDTLERLDLFDDTLLVVTSDHGEHFGEHSLMGHDFSLWEPALRIPLTVSFPRSFDLAGEFHQPVSLIDVAPTVLEVAGLPIPPAFDGRSLVSVARGVADEHPIFAHYARHRVAIDSYQKRQIDDSRIAFALSTVRVGSHKLIIDESNQRWLYNLEQDPRESENLAAAHPELVEQLEAELSASATLQDPR